MRQTRPTRGRRAEPVWLSFSAVSCGASETLAASEGISPWLQQQL